MKSASVILRSTNQTITSEPTAQPRWLIVNADDFGLSDGVNAGILAAHVNGIVTSTSLMVDAPAAGKAARSAREYPQLSIGLHLDFGEWVYEQGEWRPRYRFTPMDDAAAVRGEVDRQLDAFRRLVGREPTHLDSHQHAHRDEPLCGAAIQAARRLGVPLREMTGIGYCGGFYGQTAEGAPWPEGISMERLVALLGLLPAGVTELSCHPGCDDELPNIYCRERSCEIAVLCDPSLRTLLGQESIELVSFGDPRAREAIV